MNVNILVVDDEQEIADLVELYLKNENYTVFKFYSAREALRCIERERIDLAVLDVMMPEVSGFTICRKIREKYTYPVIMLTAKGEELDQINGLTLGADDYITKPFRPLELTPTEFSILRILCQKRGCVVSAEDLFHEVLGDAYYSKSNNTITVHIRHLREKMGVVWKSLNI